MFKDFELKYLKKLFWNLNILKINKCNIIANTAGLLHASKIGHVSERIIRANIIVNVHNIVSFKTKSINL